MAKRVLLFIVTNLLILVTLSAVLNILGVGPYLSSSGIDYSALAIFCLVWGMGGAFISLALSRVMAKMMMGVKVLTPGQAGEFESLVQMVHHLARAAGISKMPEVGVYQSPEVNAFATGPTRNRALVAFSTGLLQRMSRDEIEGVAAHEIAHIQNGDMVTMTLVQGVMNAIVMFVARVAAWGISQALASRSQDSQESSQESSSTSPFVNMIVVMVLEIALGFLASIVVFYFSRAREFRADAGAAKLAGREKMLAALERLQSAFRPNPTEEHASLATLKISGSSRGLAGLFASHPPLEARIEALRAMR
jgi:heat shock protein HtpX